MLARSKPDISDCAKSYDEIDAEYIISRPVGYFPAVQSVRTGQISLVIYLEQILGEGMKNIFVFCAIFLGEE